MCISISRRRRRSRGWRKPRPTNDSSEFRPPIAADRPTDRSDQFGETAQIDQSKTNNTLASGERDGFVAEAARQQHSPQFG